MGDPKNLVYKFFSKKWKFLRTFSAILDSFVMFIYFLLESF